MGFPRPGSFRYKAAPCAPDRRWDWADFRRIRKSNQRNMIISLIQRLGRSLDGPIVLAAFITVGFYVMVSHESMQQTLLHKYTTEHATEYVIVAMLSWGLSDLALRCLRFRRENLALQHTCLPARRGPEPAGRASEFYASIQSQPQWLQNTRLGTRLRHALVYVHEKQSADGFDDHLRDLSERDSHRTHANYAVARFVVWVSPVLGFLGTVVHFGTALGGFSSDNLADKLPIVTAEMGTAFNTTTMALGASTVIMLCMFLVERAEQGIVHEVDARADRELSNRFLVESAELSPVFSAIESSNRALLSAIAELARRQVQAWPEMLAMLHKSQQEWQNQQMQAWETIVNRQQQRDQGVETARENRLQSFLDAFESRRADHQARLQVTVDQITAVQDNLGQVAEQLAGVLKGEHQLLDLQRSLADNLQLLQQTRGFDEAVHGITAAIHLLTVRHQGPSVASPKAA